ncbi:unnamed protein product [Rotaria socialis]|nr:unnamed protein product [Rotaria socialis]
MASTFITIAKNVIMTKNDLGNEYAALLNTIIGNILDYGHAIETLSLTVLLRLFIGQAIHLLWIKTSVLSTCCSMGSFKTIETQDHIIYWQFSEKDSAAIMFYSASKTLAMGISVINALYGDTNQALTGLLSLPLIVYHAEQLIIGKLD